MDHSWNLTPKEAVLLQKKLREDAILAPFSKPIRYIGGCDVSMNMYSKHVFAGFVVLSYPDLEMVDHAVIEDDITFPYIPGLLSFREIPSLLKAWRKLRIVPDLVCVDGVGIAHPRRMGIATHLGLVLDMPTIGISKNLLTGTHEEVGNEKGSTSPLVDIKDPHEVLGAALRTKHNVKPVFVSPGHKMSTEDAVRIVKECTGKYRIPEPTRIAHNVVNEYRKKANAR
jgi:deoxyribonuclease V